MPHAGQRANPIPRLRIRNGSFLYIGSLLESYLDMPARASAKSDLAG